MTYPDIALVGPARSGKNTVADMLTSDYGYTQLAFADALRAVVADIDPHWAREVREIGYEAAKNYWPHIRQRLVDVGEAMRRHVSPAVWVDPVWAAIDHERTHDNRPIVVTDCRRDNEVECLEREGFQFWRIRRPEPGEIGDYYLTLDQASKVRTVQNIGTVGDLRLRIHSLMDALGHVVPGVTARVLDGRIVPQVGYEEPKL